MATATHPTHFGLQYSISKKTRTMVSLSSMQGVFAEASLRKQAWRNPKEVRVGCLHQNIFSRKVTDIAFTSNFCDNHSHPASPASRFLTSPHPPSHTSPRSIVLLMSLSPSSHVPKSHVPTHVSWCPCPLVPVPLLYTAQKLFQSLYLSTLLIHTFFFVTNFLMRKNCHDKWNVYFKLVDWHEISKPFA